MTKTKKIKIKVNDIVPKHATVEQLIRILPAKTHNTQPFGLMLMTTAPTGWSCNYWTHYSHTSDDRFRACIAGTPQGALKKMIAEFLRNGMIGTLTLPKGSILS